MANSTPHVIQLRLNGGKYDEREVLETPVITGQTVTPGMLVIYSGAGIRSNAAAADADAPIMWALEKEYIDPRINSNNPITVTYAADEMCRHFYSQAGDRIYALLKAGVNVAKGAPLESDGAGALQAYTSGKIVAFADEAVDNSGGSGTVRIRVRAA